MRGSDPGREGDAKAIRCQDAEHGWMTLHWEALVEAGAEYWVTCASNEVQISVLELEGALVESLGHLWTGLYFV